MKNVCVRGAKKVTIVTTVVMYSPMLRSPLARGVPRLGREVRGIVTPPLQTSSLPKIKRESVVRVETICACDCDEISRSSVVSGVVVLL